MVLQIVRSILATSIFYIQSMVLHAQCIITPCFKSSALFVAVPTSAPTSPLLCVPWSSSTRGPALSRCSDSDIGGSLQGSQWISIVTSCLSLIPPFLCSPFLPPRSWSISFLVFPHSPPSLCLLSSSSSSSPLALLLLPHVLHSPPFETFPLCFFFFPCMA